MVDVERSLDTKAHWRSIVTFSILIPICKLCDTKVYSSSLSFQMLYVVASASCLKVHGK